MNLENLLCVVYFVNNIVTYIFHFLFLRHQFFIIYNIEKIFVKKKFSAMDNFEGNERLEALSILS